MVQGVKIRSPKFDDKVRNLRKKMGSFKIARKLDISPGMVDRICEGMTKEEKAPRDVLSFGIYKTYKVEVWLLITTSKWVKGFITEDFVASSEIVIGARNGDN